VPKTASSSVASASDNRLCLYRRRWTAWFSLPFGIVMCLAGLWILVALIHTMRGGMGLVFGLAGLLLSTAFGAMLLKNALRTLRADGPALVFDENGITDDRNDTVFIPWEAVQRISSTEGDGNDLGIWFKPGGQGGGLGTVLRRAVLGADQTIPLGDLVYQPRQLASTIARLHAAARRASREA